MKASNKTQVLTGYELSKVLMPMLFVSLVLFCWQQISVAHASETNPFQLHYHPQNQTDFKSVANTPKTKIYVARNKAQDNIRMLEDGYDMMGTSGFASTDIPPETALKHGQEIKADIVLVYTQQATRRSKASRIAFLKKQAKAQGTTIDVDALQDEAVYEYFASYWAKVPMPSFGVHIVKLKQVVKLDDEVLEKKELKGLRILAVVKGSAAADAGVLRGDQLIQIGDQTINQPKSLFEAVQQFKGQTVPVKVKRENAVETLQVAFK